MATLKTYTRRSGMLLVALFAVLAMVGSPAVRAAGGDGHIGGKPDIGQGDGIPQTKPGRINAGEMNKTGDANQGDEPAQDGGDGIPNGGPIEGEEHGVGMSIGFESIITYLSLLFMS